MNLESTLGARNGVFAGMLELAALTSVLGWGVRSVYPTGFTCGCRPYINITFCPRVRMQCDEEYEENTVSIMWSCTHLMLLKKWLHPNHFVQVVRWDNYFAN